MSQPTSDGAAPSQNDASRVALPSISNLLGIADGSRPETSSGQQNAAYYNPSPSKRPIYEPGVQNSYNTDTGAGYTRYSPLLDPSQVPNNPNYAMDIDQAGPSSLKRHSAQSYEVSPYSTKPYAASPSAASDGSVYSPTASMHRQPGPYAGAMQPGYAPSAMSTPNLPASNPWEHHHYMSANSQQGIYAQLPDRYICQTCSKAFSRPSSLKIHSHSHTGEKPFKCPHAGCNKAFSVKSNMKRHEKGCHSGNGQAMPGAYDPEDQ